MLVNNKRIMLTGYDTTLSERITRPASWTGANRVVVDGSAFGIETTGAVARILTT